MIPLLLIIKKKKKKKIITLHVIENWSNHNTVVENQKINHILIQIYMYCLKKKKAILNNFIVAYIFFISNLGSLSIQLSTVFIG